MSFTSRVATMDDRVAKTFSAKTAVFHYQADLSSSIPVQVVVKNPMMEEDYVPGSPLNSQSVGVLILWFRCVDSNGVQIFTQPTKGDTVTYGAGDYDLNTVDVDREGGVTARCRLRAQRFDL